MGHIFTPKGNWKPRPDWVPTYPGLKWYSWGNCRVMVGIDPNGAWHLSISCPNRNPAWEEIKAARYDLCPHDITMAMILPPTDQYVNVHEYCFHLHEIFPDETSHLIDTKAQHIGG